MELDSLQIEWVKEEIKKEMKRCVELNENKKLLKTYLL